MKRGRKPGGLVTGICRLCGTAERTRSAGAYFRCTSCKAAGLRHPTEFSKRCAWSDMYEATALVATAIRNGELPHPRGLPCTDCDGVAVEYEHRDYNQPLKVDPICRACNHRRGPAIPRVGTIPRLLADVVPYKTRRRTEKLFVAMGLPTAVLRSMPMKLTHAHWMELLPLFRSPIQQGS